MSKNEHICPKCESTHWHGLEYDYTNKLRYDGVSEWVCEGCGYREGRWCGEELKGGEVEPKYCEGLKKHPVHVEL